MYASMHPFYLVSPCRVERNNCDTKIIRGVETIRAIIIIKSLALHLNIIKLFKKRRTSFISLFSENVCVCVFCDITFNLVSQLPDPKILHGRVSIKKNYVKMKRHSVRMFETFCIYEISARSPKKCGLN